jgi:hypothetical protein
MRPTKYKTRVRLCPETLELLKDTPAGIETLEILKKMKPARQIAAAEHIVASGNYSLGFLRGLERVTPAEQFVYVQRARQKERQRGGIIADARDVDLLIANLKRVRQSYGKEMLTLCVCLKYLERLLANSRVEWYLKHVHPHKLLTLKQLLNARVTGQNLDPNQGLGRYVRVERVRSS